MAAEGSQGEIRRELDGEAQERDKQVSALLSDSVLRDLLIQKLAEGGHVAKQGSSPQQISDNRGDNQGDNRGDTRGDNTPGGNPFSGVGWPAFPMQFPYVTFPAHPAWGSSHTLPVAAGVGSSHLPHDSALGSGQPGSSCGQDQEEGDVEEEDCLELLGDEEALELVQFEPAVDDEDAWTACDAINNYVKKTFNQVITTTTRDGIVKDYPKPKIECLSAPKLDEDVKKQIEMAGKDPHYGVEKHLYNLQKQILDMSGPLTCLWADLLNRDATVNPKDVILLLQRYIDSPGKCFIHYHPRKEACGLV